MSYFGKFPITFYQDLEGKNTSIVDVARRVKVVEDFKNALDFYTTYTVQDGERPEHVAYKFYGNAGLHWVLLLLNDIVDPWLDWPMSQSELDRYIETKYADVNAEHHKEYEVDGGFILDPNSSINRTPINANLLRSVSNAEFEARENDAKREIKILREEFVQVFVSEFNKAIAQ